MEARKGSFLAYFSPSTSFEGGSSLTKNGNKDHKIEQLKQLIPLRVDELLEYLKNIQNSISNVQTGEQLVSYKFLLGVLVEMKRNLETYIQDEENENDSFYSLRKENLRSESKLSNFISKINFAISVMQSALLNIKKITNSSNDLLELIDLGRVVTNSKQLLKNYEESSKKEKIHDLIAKDEAILRECKRVCHLYVKVAEARDLKGDFLKQYQDCYAVILLDKDRVLVSPTLYKTPNPMWLIETTFEIPNQNTEVDIEVWSEDKITKDHYIGHFLMSIKNLKSRYNNQIESWFNLVPKGSKYETSGSLLIDLNYVTLKSEGEKKTIEITIIEAENLKIQGRIYCELLISGTQIKKETHISQKMNSSKYKWDQSFTFLIDSIIDKELTLIVWNKTTLGNECLGQIKIPFSDIVLSESISFHSRNWYDLTPRNNDGRKFGTIRIRYSYMEEIVLPRRVYEDFIETIRKDEFECMLYLIESNPSDQAIQSLVDFAFVCDIELAFLKKLITIEIDNTTDVNTIFRQNSPASKALDHFLKRCGYSYLKATLGDHINTIYQSDQSFEIDPAHLDKKSSLEGNLTQLTIRLSEIWVTIFDKIDECPSSIREIFSYIKRQVSNKWVDQEVHYSAISGFIFLRFFCPAILNPKLFFLANEHPQRTTARNLVLISKTIMNLANLVEFGQKETFMVPLNSFLIKNFPLMKDYIDTLSNPSKKLVKNSNGLPIIGEKQAQDNLALARVFHHFKLSLRSIQEKHPTNENVINLANQLTELQIFNRLV